MLFIHDHRFILFHLTNKFSRRRKIYKRSFVSYELNQNAMAETGFNAYEVLGLPADSDEEAIKQKYHELAKKYHPDKQNNKSEEEVAKAKELFGKIQKAYEILTDNEARSAHDIVISEAPDYSKRPGGDAPLEVELLIYITSWGISRIDGHETLNLKISIESYWTDHRLRGWPKGKELPDDLWRPEVFARPFSTVKDEEGPTIFDRNVNDGRVRYSLPLSDMNKKLDDDFDRLKNFPYDCLRLDTFLCLSGEHRLESSKDITLKLGRTLVSGKEAHIICPAHFRSGEFIMTGMSYGLGFHTSPNMKDQKYIDLVFSCHLKRDPTFYKYKAIYPTMAIVLVSLATYSMDAADLGDRMETVIGMFLTSFAIQWTVMERLPPTPYLNNVDLGLVSALSAMGMIIVSHCTAYRISKYDEEMAATCDWVFLIAIVSLYSISQVALIFRMNKFSGKGAGRMWKEGNAFFNRMCTITEGYYCEFSTSNWSLGQTNVGEKVVDLKNF